MTREEILQPFVEVMTEQVLARLVTEPSFTAYLTELLETGEYLDDEQLLLAWTWFKTGWKAGFTSGWKAGP